MIFYFSDQANLRDDHLLYPEFSLGRERPRESHAHVMLSFARRGWKGKSGRRRVDPRLEQLIRHRTRSRR